MARTDTGLSLATPVLKPGSTSFTLTEAGFDTGSRTFTIDSASLDLAIPELDRADTDLRWTDRASSTVRGRFGTMYVVGVTNITENGNGLCEYTVNFHGLIKRQKRIFETVQTQTVPFRGEFSGNQTYGYYDSLPVVTQTRVSNEEPIASQLGDNIIPFGWVEPNPPAWVINGVTIPAIKSSRWVLREREYRRAGPLVEVREQYIYEIVR